LVPEMLCHLLLCSALRPNRSCPPPALSGRFQPPSPPFGYFSFFFFLRFFPGLPFSCGNFFRIQGTSSVYALHLRTFLDDLGSTPPHIFFFRRSGRTIFFSYNRRCRTRFLSDSNVQTFRHVRLKVTIDECPPELVCPFSFFSPS